MKLAWLTDIHLDFVSLSSAEVLADSIVSEAPDAVLITGDIANADLSSQRLTLLKTRISQPLYFVLGNHDFYNHSLKGVRESIRALTGSMPGLFWLAESGPIKLTHSTALVGHDSWYDLRRGDYRHSSVALNDSSSILELFGLTKDQLQAVCQSLADEAADYLERQIHEAAPKFSEIVVAVHVPPFPEAVLHRGEQIDKHLLPFYASKVMGEMLLRMATKYPDTKFLVLAGHSHGRAQIQVSPNMQVRVGNAQYGHPQIESILEVR